MNSKITPLPPDQIDLNFFLPDELFKKKKKKPAVEVS